MSDEGVKFVADFYALMHIDISEIIVPKLPSSAKVINASTAILRFTHLRDHQPIKKATWCPGTGFTK
jgi:hypothetical protein